MIFLWSKMIRQIHDSRYQLLCKVLRLVLNINTFSQISNTKRIKNPVCGQKAFRNQVFTDTPIWRKGIDRELTLSDYVTVVCFVVLWSNQATITWEPCKNVVCTRDFHNFCGIQWRFYLELESQFFEDHYKSTTYSGTSTIMELSLSSIHIETFSSQSQSKTQVS